MTTYWAGIDPGLHGALAVLRVDPGAQRPVLEEVHSLPIYQTVVGGKGRRRYVLAEMLKLVRTVAVVYGPNLTVIEDVVGRGNQKGSSAMGYGVGALHMACEAARLRTEVVAPSMWKAALRCPASKPGTVRIAEVRIDGIDGRFVGPKGGILDGCAEAALIAYWAWSRYGGRS
jgi:Holliday junction resolvasome RuvABC endonuclease subunit